MLLSKYFRAAVDRNEAKKPVAATHKPSKLNQSVIAAGSNSSASTGRQAVSQNKARSRHNSKLKSRGSSNTRAKVIDDNSAAVLRNIKQLKSYQVKRRTKAESSTIDRKSLKPSLIQRSFHNPLKGKSPSVTSARKPRRANKSLNASNISSN